MIRILFLCLLFGFSSPANAGPRHWLAHHKRFLAMEGVAITGASIHAAGLHHCRRLNGVEPCDEHYGEAWAMFGIVTGVNTIVMPAIAEGCWKDQKTQNRSGKFCNIFAYGGSGTQAAWGVHEFFIRRKDAKDNTSK